MGKYDDILTLPRPVSKAHPPMPVAARAAQFAPFAALTGYGDVIDEASRDTEAERELTEDARERLREKLTLLRGRLKEKPEAEIEFFEPDVRRDGGRYIRMNGPVRSIDDIRGVIGMANGTEIPFEAVLEITLPEEDLY